MNRISFTVILFIVGTALPVGNLAQINELASPETLKAEIDAATRALNDQEYERALTLFHPLAEQGNPDAMLSLGRMYQNGWGTEIDNDKAQHWLGQAVITWSQRAKNNDPRAYVSLGVLFQKGIGLEKNITKAQQYFNTAFNIAQAKAQQNDHEAQYLIGMLYSSGKGTGRDIHTGTDWLTKSAENGNHTAIKMLLHIYECGCRGLPKDDTKATYWRGKLVSFQ